MDALRIAASGMVAQEHNVEVVANNLANMNTTGYQRRRSEFHDLIYRNLSRPNSTGSHAGQTVPGGVQSGQGVQLMSVYRVTEQGSLKATDNVLDFAIQGRGYFQVQLPNGQTAYTRAGSFQLDQNGALVTGDGFPIQPGITIPQDAVDITINRTGGIMVKSGATKAPTQVGQLQLAVFPNEAGLKALGDNMFAATPASGSAVPATPGRTGAGAVLQGFLETSNVNPVKEIAELIRAQRAYDINSKIIQTADQMMSTTPSAG